MKSSKKSGGNKPAAARPRWPKGHPQAGKFAPRDLFAEFQKNLKLQEKQEKQRAARERKNAQVREARAKTRQLRMSLMAPNVRGLETHDAIDGWGSTSTSRLREGTTYAWHASITVQGLTGEGVKKALSRAESMHRKPRKNTDGTYSLTLTPWLLFGTPAEAFEIGEDGLTEVGRTAQEMAQQFYDDGAAHVELHGIFYNTNGEK